MPGVTVTVVNMSSFFTESQTTGEGGDMDLRLQSNEEFEVLLESLGIDIICRFSTIGMKNGIILLNDLRQLDFEPILIGTPVPFKRVDVRAHKGAVGPSSEDRTGPIRGTAQYEPLGQSGDRCTQ